MKKQGLHLGFDPVNCCVWVCAVHLLWRFPCLFGWGWWWCPVLAQHLCHNLGIVQACEKRGSLVNTLWCRVLVTEVWVRFPCYATVKEKKLKEQQNMCNDKILSLKCRASQKHRIIGVGRDLCGSSGPTPLPTRAGCTGPCPGGSWISPEKENPQPLWATWSYFSGRGCGAVLKWQEIVASAYSFLSGYSPVLFSAKAKLTAYNKLTL